MTDSPTGAGSIARRRRIRVTGRVQGVGFRYFVQSVARNLGLMGFVRNEPDQAVTAEVQGPAEAITEFERHMARGPALARVDSVVAEDMEVHQGEIEFAIVRR